MVLFLVQPFLLQSHHALQAGKEHPIGQKKLRLEERDGSECVPMDVCKLKHMDPFPGSVYELNFLVFICSCAQPEDP